MRVRFVCLSCFAMALMMFASENGNFARPPAAAGYWQFVKVERHEDLAGPTNCSPSRKEGGECNFTVSISKICGQDTTPYSKYKASWTPPSQILAPNNVLDFTASVTLLENRNVNWTLGLYLKGKFLPYNAPAGQASNFDTGGVGPQGNPQYAGKVFSFDNSALSVPVKIPGRGIADPNGLMQFMVLVSCSSNYWWSYVYKWIEPGKPQVGMDNDAQSSVGNLVNHARGKQASQSTTGYGGTAERAVDGNADGDYFAGKSVTHTEENNLLQPWWQVDLGFSTEIDHVVLWNRTDCCSGRLASFWVFVSDSPFPSGDIRSLRGIKHIGAYEFDGVAGRKTRIAIGRKGRYIRVQLSGRNPLSLAEVEVFGK